jgi:hypothetical protein
VEEAPLFQIGAAAGTTVEKYHWLARRVTRLLEIELVDR